MKETLERLLPKLNLSLTSAQLDTLARFGSLLLEKNQVMNLTAITEPQKVAELHFYDCLALLNAADFRAKRVVDIGCGAGFPGVPLKIAEPSMDLTLLDSLGKRMDWLREVLPELQVEANVVTARAEEYVTVCRESYDIAVSRARCAAQHSLGAVPSLCEGRRLLCRDEGAAGRCRAGRGEARHPASRRARRARV